MSFIKFVSNGINSIIFNHNFGSLKKDIEKLDPSTIKAIDLPNTILSRLHNLNKYVSTKDPLHCSTQVQGLAYELDKKVSKSGIPAEMQKDFSVRLQKAVCSSFCMLPNDLIVHIGSFLPSNREISAFEQVNHQTQTALTSPQSVFIRREKWENDSVSIKYNIESLKKEALQIDLETSLKLSNLDGWGEYLFDKYKNGEFRRFFHIDQSYSQLFDLLIKPKKENAKNINKLESLLLKTPQLFTKLASGYVHLLKEIHSLNDNDLKDPTKLESLYQKIQSANSYLVQNKLNTLEMSCLTNHLVYAFQKKLENAPESDAKKMLQEKLNLVVPVGFGHFPHDTLFLIFKDLDLKDMVTFREVCHYVCTFIDTKFAKTELFLRKKINFLRDQTHSLQMRIEKEIVLLDLHSQKLESIKSSIGMPIQIKNDKLLKMEFEEALYFNWLNTEKNRTEQLTTLQILENSLDHFPSSLNCSEIVNLSISETVDLFKPAPSFNSKFEQVIDLKNKLKELQSERESLQKKFDEVNEIINQKAKLVETVLNDQHGQVVKEGQVLELKLKNAQDALWFNGINLYNAEKELEELLKTKQKK